MSAEGRKTRAAFFALAVAAACLLAFSAGCGSKSKKSAAIPLTVITDALPDGAVGQSYSAWLEATGGSQPYSWSVDSGNLPGGLSLQANGLITGTPTTAATFAFRVVAQDSANRTATKDLAITITGLLTVVTDSLPPATVDVDYSQSLEATGGQPPYSWLVSAGTLPDGLDLSAQGDITGIPTAEGLFSFTVQVEDSLGDTDTQDLTIDSLATLTILTESPLPDGTLSVSYDETFTVAGGTPSYTWSMTAGTLAQGLSVGTDGHLAGTPEETGTFDFTIQVLDSDSDIATKDFSLTIYATPPEEWVDEFTDSSKIATSEYITVEYGMAGLERGAGSGAEQLDQSQETGGGSITSTLFGQTFVAGMTGELTKISVKCGQGANGPTDITLELTGNGVSASATTHVTSLDWYDFIFDSPGPRVIAGKQYQFMLDPESDSMEVAWNANNSGYPDGKILTREGLTLSGDLHFKTYVKEDGDFVSDTGTMTSVEIAPATIAKWLEFSFSDSEPTSASTDVTYTIEAWNTNLSQWDTPALTDADGKENGQFDDSPVDLSGLDAGVYTKLRLSATLTTTDVADPEGPAVDQWKVTYQP